MTRTNQMIFRLERAVDLRANCLTGLKLVKRHPTESKI